ncbi:MAG: GerAB/ArcD/ProY family transporter [Syntrophaceticus sp.]
MELEKGRITSTGLIMLIFGFSIGTSVLEPPGRIAGTDAWIAILIGIAESLLIAAVFLLLTKRFPGKTLVEISDIVYGPFLGKVISILFLWYLFHVGSLALGDYTDYFSALFLINTPPIVLLAAIALICISAAKKGIQVISRCGVIIVFVELFMYFLTIFLLIGNFEIKNLQPVLTTPAAKLLWASHGAASFPFAETVAFLMVIPFLKNQRDAVPSTFTGIMLAGLVMASSAVMNTGVLGASEKAYIYPSFHAITMINIGEIITRLEIVAPLFVLGMGFLKVTILLYGVSLGAAQICSLHSYRPLVVPMAVIMSILALYNFPNPAEFIRFVINAYPVYALPFQVIIPLLTLIISAIRKIQQQDDNSRHKGQRPPTKSKRRQT